MKYRAFPLVLFLALPAAAQITSLVTKSSLGVAGNQGGYLPSLSSQGWFVAFVSPSSNLVPGDGNGVSDIFVRSLWNSRTERVSVGPGGIEANGQSNACAISGDGRCVVFESSASNLVAGDTNSQPDVFVHDRLLGTTERVNVNGSGAQSVSGFYTESARISRTGRLVVFESQAGDLVAGDTNGALDVFLRDRVAHTIERVSTKLDGSQLFGDSFCWDLSPDGRFLVFGSPAPDLAPGDLNSASDVFVRDFVADTIERASVTWEDEDPDDSSRQARISPDGRFVVFTTDATNLVPGDTNGFSDVYLRDRQLGLTERVSVTSDEEQGFHDSFTPALSADGRFVLFCSLASLAPGASGLNNYLRDRRLGTTVVVRALPGSNLGSNSGACLTPDAACIALRSLSNGQIYLHSQPGGARGIH